jgi:hypothetical protein
MVLDKPLKLVIDCPALARWLRLAGQTEMLHLLGEADKQI